MHIGDSDYKKQSIRQLSKVLTIEFGKGFSRSNIYNMCQFYLTHKDVQTVSGQLLAEVEKVLDNWHKEET